MLRLTSDRWRFVLGHRGVAKPDSDSGNPEKPPSRASGEGVAEVSLALSKDSDVALIAGPTSDGKGVTVLRAKQGRLEAGEVRPLQAGKPIVGEVVSLKPRTAMPLVCDVETHVRSALPARTAPASAAPRSGPPQVASDTYRENWELIYKKKHDDLPN